MEYVSTPLPKFAWAPRAGLSERATSEGVGWGRDAAYVYLESMMV